MGCVLLYIGLRLLYEQTPWAKRKKARILEFEAHVQERLKKVLAESGHSTGRGLPPAARVRTVSWSFKQVAYEFLGETFTFNVPALFLLALVVGLIGGTYGIGGGAIIAPFLAAIFKLPMYTIAGAALLGTLVTSVAGVGIYYAIGIHPDLLLGALFGVGGFCGMYIGARLQKFVSGQVIRIGLGVVISGLALRYIVGFFTGLSLHRENSRYRSPARIIFLYPDAKGYTIRCTLFIRCRVGRVSRAASWGVKRILHFYRPYPD